MCLSSRSNASSRLSRSETRAVQTSLKLCGGMLVAMPTAIPETPLTSRFGNWAGRTIGSSAVDA